MQFFDLALAYNIDLGDCRKFWIKPLKGTRVWLTLIVGVTDWLIVGVTDINVHL